MKNTYCKKTSFANETLANEFIKKLQKTSHRDKIIKRAYLCELCYNWHLTSLESAESLQISHLKNLLENKESQINNLKKENEKQNNKINLLTTELEKQTNVIQVIKDLKKDCPFCNNRLK